MNIVTLLRPALFLALAGLAASAQASPLGTKPGAWETTTTTTMSGIPKDKQRPALSQEQLAKMTPEQRAMMENMMKMLEGKPTTMTHKHCIKDSDNMDKLTGSQKDDDRCKRKVISQSDSKIEVEATCNQPKPVVIKFKVEATSRDTVVSVMDATGEDGFHTHSESKSKWIGTSCEGIKAGKGGQAGPQLGAP